MIVIENLTKIFQVHGRRKVVADNFNMIFPTGVSVGLLGRNGAGKSTLLQLIAGTQDPTSGRIWSTGSISWPVGFAGSFHPDLSGAQNTRFIARVYGVDGDELSNFVEEFAGLGEHYRLPLRTYSSGMRSRLTFGASMGIAFDTYLVDEVTSVGDASFRAKAQRVFLDRMRKSGAIFVSHSMDMVRRLCQAAVVLENGKGVYYDNVDEAIRHHNWNMRNAA